MPRSLITRIAACALVAAPAIVLRVAGVHIHPVADLLVFGAAVVAASFLLAWAAEAAQKDISGALAIALLALIAVLPEYAVDLYYAFQAGSDAAYAPLAAANMTGSNRLLLGFGWPLVVIVALWVANRGLGRRDPRRQWSLTLPRGARLDVGFLALLAVAAFVIPLLGEIPVWFGVALIGAFALYLWRAGRSEGDGEPDFVGAAADIANLPATARRATVITLFAVAAAIIVLSAEPFAEALIGAGGSLGVDSYFLVQWLAPLASEAPEFIIAVLFALRGHGAAAIATLIASKINQWSLLVGSLPLAHLAGGGGGALALDARQIEEFVLTGTQTILGVAIILALRFHLVSAVSLAALFAAQFFVPDTTGRYVLAVIQLVIAVGFLIANRREIAPTLAAPFRRVVGAGGVDAAAAAVAADEMRVAGRS